MATQNYASKNPERALSLESGTRILYNEIGAVSRKTIRGIAVAALLIAVPLTLYLSKGSRGFVYRNVPGVKSTVDTYNATTKIPAQLDEILRHSKSGAENSEKAAKNTDGIKGKTDELRAPAEKCACDPKPGVKHDYKKSQGKKYKPSPNPVPSQAELPPYQHRKPGYESKLPKMIYIPPQPSAPPPYIPPQPTHHPSALSQSTLPQNTPPEPPRQPSAPPKPVEQPDELPKKPDTETPKIEARMPEQPKTLCELCTFEPGRDLNGKELKESGFYNQFKDKIAR